jgi:UDP-3-O-[3-hydroxymyristoyl] N-acetylglucosamine deacetylase
MFQQRTLRRPISCTGRGLHSGKKVVLSLKPAEEDHGIVFVRTDKKDSPPIRVCPENVIDTQYATTLGHNGSKVSTVEHLLAALYGSGIDNLVVEVDSPELPIMDGSAAPFIYLIHSAGIEIQNGFKKFLEIKRPIVVEDGDKRIYVHPARDFKVTYTIDFYHPLLRNQSYSWLFSTVSFEKDIAKARTFGFLKEVEKMRSVGLAKGGTLDNAVVLSDYYILNEDGLRYRDEFVRHKILDLLGDLSILGAYLLGHVKVKKSGHQLNHRFVNELLSTPSRINIFRATTEDEDAKKHDGNVHYLQNYKSLRA